MTEVTRIEKLKRTSMVSIHDGVAHVAGMCGNPGESIQEQTRVALAKVDKWLAAAGTDKSKILRATVWVADRSHFAPMNEVWEEWVDAENPPSRAAGVVPPAAEGYDVEIIVTAAI
ncbi:RidA family protein [Seohaeicola zhoushanensis]|uniref:RidA family protein n=1 Tax=Seohaeicola zhoushanensis TaxID=1569283 RepID=A0A8J3H2C4_9RHOB|nr:RidA family protein [Seohaeicola zhoushanensis]GHF68918.1 hypothetical protein GCM10017056_45020 [Seohaeicola zhoushanensis]